MSKKFVPTLRAGEGYSFLKLQGILDEDNYLLRLISQIQGRFLIIELSDIERINSCGVRDWVNWLNQIRALNIEVVLLNCSPAVVGQINMVKNFSSDAHIYSFYAPYVHPDTGEEINILLLTSDLLQDGPAPKAPDAYAEDGTALEFDEFEESYFAFLSDSKILASSVNPELQPVLDYFIEEKLNEDLISAKCQILPKKSSVSVIPVPRAQERHDHPPIPSASNYRQIDIGTISSTQPAVTWEQEALRAVSDEFFKDEPTASRPISGINPHVALRNEETARQELNSILHEATHSQPISGTIIPAATPPEPQKRKLSSSENRRFPSSQENANGVARLPSQTNSSPQQHSSPAFFPKNQDKDNSVSTHLTHDRMAMAPQPRQNSQAGIPVVAPPHMHSQSAIQHISMASSPSMAAPAPYMQDGRYYYSGESQVMVEAIQAQSHSSLLVKKILIIVIILLSILLIALLVFVFVKIFAAV